jgi:hypothetical protein
MEATFVDTVMPDVEPVPLAVVADCECPAFIVFWELTRALTPGPRGTGLRVARVLPSQGGRTEEVVVDFIFALSSDDPPVAFLVPPVCVDEE